MSERRPHVVRWIAIAVAVPLALLIYFLATREDAATRLAQSPLLGRAAPAVTAQSLDGQTVTLEQYKGKWVLVNFFATWCIPCRNEHPDLVNFAARHATTGDATVLGIVYSDSDDAVRGFIHDRGGTWPVLDDPSGRIALDFGVSGVPESYLVSSDGTVAAKIVGGIDETRLEQLLARVRSGLPAG